MHLSGQPLTYVNAPVLKDDTKQTLTGQQADLQPAVGPKGGVVQGDGQQRAGQGMGQRNKEQFAVERHLQQLARGAAGNRFEIKMTLPALE